MTEEQAHEICAAKEPKSLWLVEGATHSRVSELALDALIPEVIAFLSEVLNGSPDRTASLS